MPEVKEQLKQGLLTSLNSLQKARVQYLSAKEDHLRLLAACTQSSTVPAILGFGSDSEFLETYGGFSRSHITRLVYEFESMDYAELKLILKRILT